MRFILVYKYSTIWLAKAIPEDGQVITLEMLDMHAEVV